jgi:hemolysin activation/secretion protein
VQNRFHVESSLASLGSVRGHVRMHDRLQMATRVAGDHALMATALLQLTTSDSPLDAFLLGGMPGSRGFHNQGLWARDAATVALEYQIPVWRPSWGVWTVLGFVDAGTVGFADTRQTFVQPGAGFRMYLRQVALPALGVDVTYSLAEGGMLASVSAGITL